MRGVRNTARRSEQGFTLLELVLVVAVIAIVAGSVLVLGRPGSGSADLRRVALTMAAQMRTARTHAISRNMDARFTIDLSRRLYWSDASRQPADIPEGVEAVLETAESEVFTESIASVRFHPDGRSSGGAVLLRSGRAGSYRISVGWLTGQVKVHQVN
ncbi:MAG: GspH/FimT family pseudopilin [Pseudomonadota bacterium]